MGPIGHAAASLGLGGVAWAATGSPLALPVAVTTGVLVDLDHVIDFFDSKDQGRRSHMFRPFHAWEYLLLTLVVLLIFSQHPLLLVAFLGYLSHLLLDQFVNRVHPLAYFIVFRAAHGFRRRHLTPYYFSASYQNVAEAMPWWGKLEPSIWRLVEHLRHGKR